MQHNSKLVGAALALWLFAGAAYGQSISPAPSASSTPPSGAAGGDLSGTYPNPSVAKVNGTSVPSGPSTHQVPVVTGTNAVTYKTVPDCTDTGGNHLNYTQSGDTFSCGTSSAGGGGGLTWLATCTAPGNTTTILCEGFVSATYNAYKFVFIGITMQTSTADLGMQIGTGGTPTYDTGTNYDWMDVGVVLGSPTTPVSNGASGATSDKIGVSLGTTAGFVLGGEINWENFNSTSLRKIYSGHIEYINSTPSQVLMTIGGDWATTATAATALRLISSSGNITAGSVYVYGLQKQ